jgi:hypothetical protein
MVSEDLLNQRLDLGDVLLDHVPYDLEVHSVIAMDDAISHPGHAPPGNCRVLLPKAHRKPLGSLPMISSALTTAKLVRKSISNSSYAKP